MIEEPERAEVSPVSEEDLSEDLFADLETELGDVERRACEF